MSGVDKVNIYSLNNLAETFHIDILVHTKSIAENKLFSFHIINQAYDSERTPFEQIYHKEENYGSWIMKNYLMFNIQRIIKELQPEIIHLI